VSYTEYVFDPETGQRTGEVHKMSSNEKEFHKAQWESTQANIDTDGDVVGNSDAGDNIFAPLK